MVAILYFVETSRREGYFGALKNVLCIPLSEEGPL